MQLLVGDIDVISTTETTRIHSSSLTNQVQTPRKAQPIQVDENDPILSKAIKVDHLCTDDRDYYLLQSNDVSPEEYAKLSLESETTDDSHVQQSSLPHCDDSLSTTVSEESDCASAVRVYDLNKRETKILRHDIIKRSRNPVGDSTTCSIDNLGNCCSLTANTKDRSESPLQTAIQQFNNRILENTNETRRPPRSPTKFKSTHLNRNPRKLKMSDVQLMNDAFGTSLDPKIIEELQKTTVEIVSLATVEVEKKSTTITDNFLENERKSSKVNIQSQDTKCHDEGEDDKQQITEKNNDFPKVLVNKCANNEFSVQNEQNRNGNIEYDKVTTESDLLEQAELMEKAELLEKEKLAEITELLEKEKLAEQEKLLKNVESMEKMEFVVVEESKQEELPSTLNDQIQVVEIHSTEPVKKDEELDGKVYERNYEVRVQVNEHKEKSVIEEDVIPALPSVKELARSFSTKKDDDSKPEVLHRPKVSVHSVGFD